MGRSRHAWATATTATSRGPKIVDALVGKGCVSVSCHRCTRSTRSRSRRRAAVYAWGMVMRSPWAAATRAASSARSSSRRCASCRACWWRRATRHSMAPTTDKGHLYLGTRRLRQARPRRHDAALSRGGSSSLPRRAARVGGRRRQQPLGGRRRRTGLALHVGRRHVRQARPGRHDELADAAADQGIPPAPTSPRSSAGLPHARPDEARRRVGVRLQRQRPPRPRRGRHVRHAGTRLARPPQGGDRGRRP